MHSTSAEIALRVSPEFTNTTILSSVMAIGPVVDVEGELNRQTWLLVMPSDKEIEANLAVELTEQHKAISTCQNPAVLVITALELVTVLRSVAKSQAVCRF